ncbi:uncharacterized protein LOC119866122 [Canis lupus familiaris]|uniref:uncharacterized protein LOC119866122 n=1 Tax=Canis lupus familiaris TaxID=9615 RepID=UPI0018F7D8CF|nr:uncharacterized protein LOC119866122 [Canis lupus familiaris]
MSAKKKYSRAKGMESARAYSTAVNSEDWQECPLRAQKEQRPVHGQLSAGTLWRQVKKRKVTEAKHQAQDSYFFHSTSIHGVSGCARHWRSEDQHLPQPLADNVAKRPHLCRGTDSPPPWDRPCLRCGTDLISPWDRLISITDRPHLHRGTDLTSAVGQTHLRRGTDLASAVGQTHLHHRQTLPPPWDRPHLRRGTDSPPPWDRLISTTDRPRLRHGTDSPPPWDRLTSAVGQTSPPLWDRPHLHHGTDSSPPQTDLTSTVGQTSPPPWDRLTSTMGQTLPPPWDRPHLHCGTDLASAVGQTSSPPRDRFTSAVGQAGLGPSLLWSELSVAFRRSGNRDPFLQSSYSLIGDGGRNAGGLKALPTSAAEVMLSLLPSFSSPGLWHPACQGFPPFLPMCAAELQPSQQQPLSPGGMKSPSAPDNSLSHRTQTEYLLVARTGPVMRQ